ncbi:hypothetical protein GGTG_09361 [Gaeumannomyces tritici R3-111a-1]|uniref:Uncharacterized protein n=1 Tax=Gaeumannomyces tritici (strain R3-111a-1) TaxID=644352 RepID=J3P764_GAET3|nr:hypothetical protein GGTG_09361 [Gaeumannomyces tritici R3-111a-1]EJT72495.1 hypothetical protein GGTG_09361 [Gaeumannomyces tritici R3-111a-1]
MCQQFQKKYALCSHSRKTTACRCKSRILRRLRSFNRSAVDDCEDLTISETVITNVICPACEDEQRRGRLSRELSSSSSSSRTESRLHGQSSRGTNTNKELPPTPPHPHTSAGAGVGAGAQSHTGGARPLGVAATVAPSSLASVGTGDLVALDRGTSRAVPLAAPSRPAVVVSVGGGGGASERQATVHGRATLDMAGTSGGATASASASARRVDHMATTTTTTTNPFTARAATDPRTYRPAAQSPCMAALVKQRNGQFGAYRVGMETASADVSRLLRCPHSSSGGGVPTGSRGGRRVDETLPGVTPHPASSGGSFFPQWQQPRDSGNSARPDSSSPCPQAAADDEPPAMVHELDTVRPATSSSSSSSSHDDGDDDDEPDFSRGLDRSDSLFLPTARDPLYIATDNQAAVTSATGFLPRELLVGQPVRRVPVPTPTARAVAVAVAHPVHPAPAAVDNRTSLPSARRQAEQEQEQRAVTSGSSSARRSNASSRRGRAAGSPPPQPQQHHHHHHRGYGHDLQAGTEPRAPSDVCLQFAGVAASYSTAAGSGTGSGTGIGAAPRRRPSWHTGDDDCGIYNA